MCGWVRTTGFGECGLAAPVSPTRGNVEAVKYNVVLQRLQTAGEPARYVDPGMGGCISAAGDRFDAEQAVAASITL